MGCVLYLKMCSGHRDGVRAWGCVLGMRMGYG